MKYILEIRSLEEEDENFDAYANALVEEIGNLKNISTASRDGCLISFNTELNKKHLKELIGSVGSSSSFSCYIVFVSLKMI